MLRGVAEVGAERKCRSFRNESFNLFARMLGECWVVLQVVLQMIAILKECENVIRVMLRRRGMNHASV
jgi:hypothetical protein